MTSILTAAGNFIDDGARVSIYPSPVIGSTTLHLKSAATTNATLVKGAAGSVYGYEITNTVASARYVKFYDKATAPVPGTDTPKFVVVLPASGAKQFSIPQGIQFALGIGLAVTGGVADSDTTAVAVNDVILNAFYA